MKMVRRARMKKATSQRGALQLAMGDYKMEGPNNMIPPMMKDLPSLKDLDMKE